MNEKKVWYTPYWYDKAGHLHTDNGRYSIEKMALERIKIASPKNFRVKWAYIELHEVTVVYEGGEK